MAKKISTLLFLIGLLGNSLFSKAQADTTKLRCISCSCLKGKRLSSVDSALNHLQPSEAGIPLNISNPSQPFAFKDMARYGLKSFEQYGLARSSTHYVAMAVNFAASTSSQILTREMSTGDFLRYDLQKQLVMFISDGKIIFFARFPSDEEMFRINGRSYPHPVAELLEKRIYMAMRLSFEAHNLKFRPASLSEHFNKHAWAMVRGTNRFPNADENPITPEDYEESARMHIEDDNPATLTVIVDQNQESNSGYLLNFPKAMSLTRIDLDGLGSGALQTGFNSKGYIFTHHHTYRTTKMDWLLSTSILGGFAKN